MPVTYIDCIPGFDEAESRLSVQTCDKIAFVRSSGCLMRIDLEAGRIDWLVERSRYQNDDTGAELSQRILLWGKDLWVNQDVTVVAELTTGQDGGLVVAARSAVDGRLMWNHSIPVEVQVTAFIAADPYRLVICLFRETRRFATEAEGFEPPPYRCHTEAIRLDLITGHVLWSGSFPGMRIGLLQKSAYGGIWSDGTTLGRLDFETGSNSILHRSASVLGDPVACGTGLAVPWHNQKEIGVDWVDEGGRLTQSSRFLQPKVHSTRLHNTGNGLALQANDAAMLWWYGDEDHPLWSVRAKPYIYRVYRSADSDVFVGTDGMGGRVFGFDPQSGRETLNLKPALGGAGSLLPVDEHSLLVASFRISKSYSQTPRLLMLSIVDRSHQLAYECQSLEGTWAHGAICRAGDGNERLAIIDVREPHDTSRTILSPTASDQGQPLLPPLGAVYAFKLPDGRYGACRVLGHLPPRRSRDAHCRGPCAVVAATPWIGATLPDLNEPQLRQVFTLSHRAWTGRQQIRMIPGRVGRGITFVGTIELDPEELRVEPVGSSYSWRDCTRFWGHQLLEQWNWDHSDRAPYASS